MFKGSITALITPLKNGKVDESIYYQDALPVKENNIISAIHTIIRSELERFLKTEEYYEGPFTNMVFDECIEGDSPYHGPIFLSDDLSYIGIIVESEFEMDEVKPLCKEAIQHDTYFILNSGDIYIQCVTFGKEAKKKHYIFDSLRLTILTKEFSNWITHEAYK